MIAERKRILLVASPGGHFVQLSLIADCFDCCEITVVSTYKKKPAFIAADKYIKIDDFNRNTLYKVVGAIAKSLEVLKIIKPDLVISTGAAPGLVMVLSSKVIGIRSIWIDSIANSRKLSLSGLIAKKAGVVVLSQWEDVAKKHFVKFEGRVV